MKKELLLTLASCVAISFCASAKMLTPEAALSRYYASEANDTRQRIAAMSPECVYSYTINGTNTCYVYNHGSDRGFMILSGSDKAPALLGYSEEGNFSVAEMPTALRGWLEECGEMIIYAEENGLRVAGAPAAPELQSIAPVTKTKWNQDSPYNDLCPRYNDKPTYTGCAATAVAQVMKTYAYPESGEGIVAYNWQNQELKVDYSKQFYNWSEMLDEYGATATEAQKQQVANLMYTVGVSGKMIYGTSASSASGIDMASGLVRNFKYDKALQYLLRDYYKLDEWSRMLHSELAQGHAVFYGGQSAQGGHAFVIDGYNSADGFFHVNWGWGGLSDGYYNIVTLEPAQQGIGGSISGFNSNQAAVFNLKPAQSGSDYFPSVCINTDFRTVSRTYKRNQKIELIGGSYRRGIMPYSIVPLEYTYGVKLTDDHGNVTYVWSEEVSDQTLNPTEGMTGYTVPASGFPAEGEYTMTPVFKCHDKIYDVKVAINCSQAVKCTASATELKFKTMAVTPNLQFSQVEFNSTLNAGRPFSASVEVVNKGEEFMGKINGVIMKDYSVIVLYDLGKFDIPSGATEKIQFDGGISENVLPGEYQFAFTSEDGAIISALQNINIEESLGPTEALIEYVNFPISDGGTGTIEDPAKVYSKTFLLEADLHCTTGYFNMNVTALLYKPTGGRNIAKLETSAVNLAEGQSTTLQFAYDISSVCYVDETYVVQFAKSDGTTVTFLEPSPDKPIYFTVVGLTSGIDDVADDAEPLKVEYFDYMGRKVVNPEKGRMLIKKATYSAGYTEITKVIC